MYNLSTADTELTQGAEPIEINNAGQILIAKESMGGGINAYAAMLMSPGVNPPSVTLAVSQSEVIFSPSPGQTGLLTRDIQVTLTGADAATTGWSVSPVGRKCVRVSRLRHRQRHVHRAGIQLRITRQI
jgi:hypothetical protein